MFKDLLGQKRTLVHDAIDEVVTMLERAESMFGLVCGKLLEDGVDVDIGQSDADINMGERMVRRMVFQHLMVNPHQDLPASLSLISIVHDVERIGDYAKNIAKRTTPIAKVLAMGGTAQSIARMAAMVQGMIKNVLDAYINRDLDMAADVRARDEEVDQMHTSLFRELLTYMMEDPRNITAATHLVFTAKNVERIGDHATGIAEQVHFMVAGELPGEMRPKSDNASFTVVEAE